MTWLTKPPLTRILKGVAAAWFLAALPVFSSPAHANNWGEMAMISETLGVFDSRICIGEASRGDLGCPTYSPTISSTGRINASAGLTVNTVSLTTTGTTWGYLGSSQSYLPSVSAAQVSATAISTTAVQIASTTTALACTSTNAGTLRYNSTNTALELCTGSGWQVMGVGIPAGTISAFASTTCPTGWSEYTPARGRFLRGIDNGAGNDPSGLRTPGNVQEDAFQTHQHFIVNDTAGQDNVVAFADPNGDNTYSSGGNVGYRGDAYVYVGNPKTGRFTTETRPKNVAVTFCQFNGTSNGWNNPLSGGSTVPGGNTGQIQFNSAGAFSGSAGLTWDNAASRFTATNISATSLTVNGLPVTGSAAATDRLVSGSNVLRLSNSASLDLLTTGEARLNVLGGSTGTAAIEVGNGRTGNGFSYIDLVGDATYSDYGLRLIRDNAGPNANSWLQHRGTGGLNLWTLEAAPITLGISSTERMRVAADGNVGIGTAVPSETLHVVGSLGVRNSQWSGDGWRVFHNAADVTDDYGLIFRRGNTPILTLANVGGGGTRTSFMNTDVGIGTTDPLYTLDVSGTVRATSFIGNGASLTGGLTINNNAPTISFQDTDHRSGFIHMNANFMYFLSSNANNATSWTQNGSHWPLTLNMTNDAAVFGGNVSIPEGELYVGSSVNVQGGNLTLSTGGANYWLMTKRAESFSPASDINNLVFAYWNGSSWNQAVDIASSGNVGIGTAVPAHRLDVNGAVRATAFLYSSDAALKKNIAVSPGLEILRELRGVTFDWKANGKHASGVIAQEVEKVMPHAVKTGHEGTKLVDYLQLIAPLIEAAKELKTENDALKAQMDAHDRALRAANDNLARLEQEIQALKQSR